MKLSILECMNDSNYYEQIGAGILASTVELNYIPGIISSKLCKPVGLVGLNQLYPSKDKAELHQQASDLLREAYHCKDIPSDKVKAAVELIHEHGLTNFGYISRCIVYYPYLLYLFLEVHQIERVNIDDDDLADMFAGCIEYHPIDTKYADESFQHLLNYKTSQTKSDLEIKLLPGKYSINTRLYALAQSHGIGDRYYNQPSNELYHYSDLVIKHKEGRYIGFRDAYHLLLYGSINHLQSLIIRWDIWGEDITTDAAREFFQLPAQCPIQTVIDQVNTKCRSYM